MVSLSTIGARRKVKKIDSRVAGRRPSTDKKVESKAHRHENMTAMTAIVLPLLIGIVAGLRAMTAPAVTSWAARVGALNVAPTSLAFLGFAWTPWIFTALALVELVTDQLPTTPSRTVLVQFGTRILMGALCGAAIAATGGALVMGLVAGIVGAIIGTLGGRAFRARLAAFFGSDRPAALIEDAVAIGGAVLIVMALP
jgi:uncharacterized membrane protein